MEKMKSSSMQFYFLSLITFIILIIGIVCFIFLRPEYDMSSITFSDSTVVYDGTEHSIEIDGDLPNSVNVTYYYDSIELSGETNVGTYTVTASFNGNILHKLIDDMTATLTIISADTTIDDLTFSDKTVTYDGDEHSIEVEGTLPSNFSVSYTYDGEELSGETNAGEYTVVATLTDSSGNYNDITMTATLTIESKDLSNVVSFNDETVDYDGYSHSLEVDDLPDSVYVTYTYNSEELDGVTDVGTYTVVANMTSSNDNYSDATLTATLEITYTTDYEYDITDDTASLTLYSGEETNIKVPKKVEDESGNIYTVTAISRYCFSTTKNSYSDNIVSVEMSDQITSIGDSTFSDCSSLTTVTMSDSISSIKDYTFSNCVSLTSINISENVTSIGKGAFLNCESLTSIELPDSITEIGRFSFYNCESLISVTLPENLTVLNDYVFANCESLISITFNSSLISIEYECFYNCNSLTTITLPSSLEEIGIDVFTNCDSLETIIFSDTTSSWYVSVNSGGTDTLVDITNSTQNVTYFTDTYCQYYWTKE